MFRQNRIIKLARGVRGRVVKVVDFNPHRCGFESRQGLWILSCEEAIQLAYGTRTRVQVYVFQVINDVFDGTVLKSSLIALTR
jgi:hypothetical protein